MADEHKTKAQLIDELNDLRRQVIDGSNRDMTDHKRMEEELIRTHRLQVAGELSAGVSHNLNNILNSILLPAEFLLMTSSDSLVLKQAQIIYDAGIRAQNLAHSLHLSIRGLAADELQPVSLSEMVTQAIEMTRPRWRDELEARGFALEIRTELEDAPGICGTPSRLHDLFVNLLFNALDAMPKGGTVTIASERAGRYVRLIFGDTGTGMDETTQKHLFEPFFTTKSEGTGLGLHAVHNTVTQWGGKIDVASTPGQGTTFTILLPIWQGTSEDESVGEVRHTTRPARLFIVEGDDGTRKLLERLLAQQHQVRAFCGGQEAIEAFSPGAFDVALIDLGMPNMPGDKVAHEILQQDSGIVTILITGWELQANDSRLRQFDFIIQKPFSDLDKIERVVAQATELHDQRMKGAPRC